MELMLLALLGVAAAGLILDGDSGSDPEPENDEPISVPEGGSTTGTDGDDTINGVSPGYVANLLGGAGDDLITFDHVDSVDAGDGDDTISGNYVEQGVTAGDGNDLLDLDLSNGPVLGGTGDDTITTSQVYYAGVYGEDGDDVITDEGISTEIYGSAGHDSITLMPTQWDEGRAVFGDDGDDTITLFVDNDMAYLNDGVLSGGDGADRFIINLVGDVQDELDGLTNYEEESSNEEIGNIADFDPAVDHLDISIPSSQGTYQGYSIENLADSSVIVLEYQVANPENAADIATILRTIHIEGVPDLTDSDFTLTVQP